MTTSLLANIIGKIAVSLHRNGRAVISVDFEDAGSIFSAKCMECLKAKCVEPLNGGCDSLKDKALEGPAAGASKAQLCNETMACVVATHCGSTDPPDPDSLPKGTDQLPTPIASTGDLSNCYCGAVPGTPCVDDGKGTGLCKLVFDRAYEAVMPLDVPVRFHDASFAGGVAMNLLACAADNCGGCL